MICRVCCPVAWIEFGEIDDRHYDIHLFRAIMVRAAGWSPKNEITFTYVVQKEIELRAGTPYVFENALYIFIHTDLNGKRINGPNELAGYLIILFWNYFLFPFVCRILLLLTLLDACGTEHVEFDRFHRLFFIELCNYKTEITRRPVNETQITAIQSRQPPNGVV